MPTEVEAGRRTRTVPWLLLAAIVATTLWLVGLLPSSWGRAPRGVTHSIDGPGIVLVPASLLLLWLAFVAANAARLRELPAMPTEPPLLGPISLPPCRARRPVVTVTGLEPGAGASTLVFNLAVLLATLGELRDQTGVAKSVRPVCVLAEGALTSALGLNPGPLADLVDNPYRLMPRLLELAVHHPTGCELLCLSVREAGPRRLVALVDQLRYHYDAVLVDGALGDDAVLDITSELGELLLVGLPTAPSLRSAGTWAERVWTMRLERKAALLVNRAGAGKLAAELTAGFIHAAQLPEEAAIANYDSAGLPWSLDARLSVARRYARMAEAMFPSLLPEAPNESAV